MEAPYLGSFLSYLDIFTYGDLYMRRRHTCADMTTRYAVNTITHYVPAQGHSQFLHIDYLL